MATEQEKNPDQSNLPVSEREGFQGFADVEEKTTSDGTPVITIAPVITPKPAQETFEQEAPATSLITGEGKAAQQAAEKQIESIQAVEEDVTIDSVIESARSGKPVTVGTVTYSRIHASRIDKNSPNYSPKERLKALANIARNKKDAPQNEPVIAFTDPTGMKVQVPSTIEDPELRDLASDYAANRIQLNDYLRPLVPDANVRQIFVDEYVSNSMTKSLLDRLAEEGRFIVNGPTALGVAGTSALDSLLAARRNGTSFSDEWNARSGQRESDNKYILDAIDNAPFLSGPTLAMHFNNEIRRVAKERLDDGTMTEEQYNSIVFEKVGDKLVEKNYVTEEMAYGLLDLSFGNLNNMEQMGVYALNFGLTGGVGGFGKATKAGREVKKFKELLENPDNAAILEGVTDYKTALKIIKKENTNTKLNNDLIDFGMKMESINRQNKQLNIDIASSNKKLKSLARAGRRNTQEYLIEKSRLGNLKKLRVRNVLNRSAPYIREASKDTAIASLGTWAGYTYLPEFTNGAVSPEMGEVIGFMGMAFGGTSATKYTAGKFVGMGKSVVGAGDAALRVIDTGSAMDKRLGMAGSFMRFASKLNPLEWAKDTTVRDYEDLVFKPQYGRAMTMKERQAIKKAMKEISAASDETKQELLNSWDNYDALVERLVAGLPEKDKLDAANFLDMSIAQLTGYSFVKAGESLRKMETGELTKNGLDNIIHAQKQARQKIERLEALITNFEENILNRPEAGLTTPIRDFVNDAKNMIDVEKRNLNEELGILSANYEAYVKAATSNANMTGDMSSTFLQDIIESRLYIADAMGETIEAEKYVKNIINAFQEEMTDQMLEVLRGRKAKGNLRKETARLAEKVIFQQMNVLTARGDAAYADLRKFIQNTANERPGIDISNAVEMMVDIAGETADSDIRLLFGAEGRFFQSPAGRKAQLVFNRMVTRTMNQYGEDAMDSLQQLYAEALVSEGKYGTVEEALEEVINMRPFEFGLVAHQTGLVNIFNNVELDEVDTMRRALRDYGYRVTDKEFGRKFKEFARILDEAVESSDPVGFEELKKARAIYADAVGDTGRQGGTFYKLKKSQQGGEKQAQDPDALYQYIYAGVDPMSVFEPITKNIAKVMRDRGDETSLQTLQKAVNDFSTQFAQRVGGKPVFKLHTAEGQSAFDMIRQLTELQVYDAWSRDYFAAVRQKRTGAVVDPKRTYDFTRSEDMVDLEDNMMVLVQRTPDSEPVPVPLVDLSRMYELEDVAMTQMDRGEDVFKAFEEFITTANANLSKGKAQAAKQIQERQDALETLSVLTRTSQDVTGMDFFSRYIEGAGEDLDDLRTLFVETFKGSAAGKNKTDDEILELFDSAATSLVYRSLKNIGGYAVTNTRGRSLDGGDYMMSAFQETEQLLATLGNPEIRERLSIIMSDDQISYLYDIADYMHLQNVKTVGVGGGLKGMSPNQLMSHAYNNARGLVSPLWTSTDIAIRLMAESNIDIMLLALESKDAARIMRNILAYPDLVTTQDLDTFDVLVKEFMFVQLRQQGNEAIVTDYFNMIQQEQPQQGENNEEDE